MCSSHNANGFEVVHGGANSSGMEISSKRDFCSFAAPISIGDLCCVTIAQLEKCRENQPSEVLAQAAQGDFHARTHFR